MWLQVWYRPMHFQPRKYVHVMEYSRQLLVFVNLRKRDHSITTWKCLLNCLKKKKIIRFINNNYKKEEISGVFFKSFPTFNNFFWFDILYLTFLQTKCFCSRAIKWDYIVDTWAVVLFWLLSNCKMYCAV